MTASPEANSTAGKNRLLHLGALRHQEEEKSYFADCKKSANREIEREYRP